MPLAINSIAYPLRSYADSRSHGTSIGTGSLSSPRQTRYTVDGLVDVRGRRVDRVKVLEDIGSSSETATLFCAFTDRWNTSGPLRRIHYNNASWLPGTDYLSGAFVVANAKLWECEKGGTAALAGSGPAGSDTAVDGTVTWVERLGPPASGHRGSTSDGNALAAQTATIYRVLAYNIATGLWVEDYYPETELVAALPYREWLDLPDNDLRQADPTTVLPNISVRHVDMDSLPEDVGDLARIVELTGGL